MTIPNRYLFLEHIRQRISKDASVSLMFVDVVRFSDVSASFSYRQGDSILLAIANRIMWLFKGKAELGRISGDIFGLIFDGKHSEEKLRSYYEFLIDHFKTPIALHDHAFVADFNVGAVTNLDDNQDVNLLVSRAESALKQAKENKYENFAVARLQENTPTSRSLTLKADLNRAFVNNELELYFQPKVNLQTLDIEGAECLLRWNHPLDGVLFPGALIEAAESYNMMNEIGYWVLENAFRGAYELIANNIEIQLSVNISPTQLYDMQFIDKVSQLGKKYHVNMRNIQLELTEDVALSSSLLVRKQLTDARNLGLSISVDDFGKGYSNLAYIRDLEIDTIKIDKTFVLGLAERPVNKAIIEATQLIANALDCEVVAEGIEEIEHLHILQSININIGQGFLFSKALPLKDFIALIHTGLDINSSQALQSKVG
jgi:diguanylate cyclase (GGDEF)-like protein